MSVKIQQMWLCVTKPAEKGFATAEYNENLSVYLMSNQS